MKPERWLANHAVTELWSGWDDRAIAWTVVPQWSIFQQVEPQRGKRIHVHYYGNHTSEEGDVWVDAQDVGPIDRPPRTTEPEWPHPAPPREEAVYQNPSYHPPTAPPIPPDQLPHLAAAARSAQVDVTILAATAARESGFAATAYREEPELAFVRWRRDAADPLDRFPDGSLGPCQILRSNFLAYGIDNDADGYAPDHNYRVAALIVRDNVAAFPNDLRKAVAAYNVGQYGAKIGRVPADNYVDTILGWAKEYAALFARALPESSTSPSVDAEPTSTPPSTSGAETAGPTALLPPVSPGSANGGAAAGGTGAAGFASGLIQYGLTLLATPYVFGGKFIPRDKGIDCSGFVCEVFEHCGVRLGDREYLSAEAIRQMTRPISEAVARTGDLIFFQNTYDCPGASHIGIWIGDGKMLDCHTSGGVQITNVHQPYWQDHFLAIGRLPQLDQLPAPALATAAPVPPAAAPPSPPDAPLAADPDAASATRCAFCGRDRLEVQQLVTGIADTAAAICDGCISLYANLMTGGLPIYRS